jgi:hypothetical protein
MFDTRRESMGIGYCTTLTWLIFGLRLPLVAASRPLGAALFALAVACMMALSVPAQPRSPQTI